MLLCVSRRVYFPFPSILACAVDISFAPSKKLGLSRIFCEKVRPGLALGSKFPFKVTKNSSRIDKAYL